MAKYEDDTSADSLKMATIQGFTNAKKEAKKDISEEEKEASEKKQSKELIGILPPLILKDSSPENEKKDDEQMSLLEKARLDKEETFANERKKAIQKVPVTLGYVTLVVFLVFVVLLGYYSKNIALIVSTFEDCQNNIDAELVILNRFAYLSASLLYYRSFLKGMTKYEDKIDGQAKFLYYFSKAIDNEENVYQLEIYPPAPLIPLANMLIFYDQPTLCQNVQQFGSTVNISWCSGISSGILKEGLRKSISSIMTRMRNQYMQISLSPNPDAAKFAEMLNVEFIEQIMIFLNIYNPLFDTVNNYSNTIFDDYSNYAILLMTIDFVVMLFIILSGLIVLITYFVAQMENQIFISRGIVALLPEAMLKKSSMLHILKGN